MQSEDIQDSLRLHLSIQFVADGYDGCYPRVIAPFSEHPTYEQHCDTKLIGIHHGSFFLL